VSPVESCAGFRTRTSTTRETGKLGDFPVGTNTSDFRRTSPRRCSYSAITPFWRLYVESSIRNNLFPQLHLTNLVIEVKIALHALSLSYCMTDIGLLDFSRVENRFSSRHVANNFTICSQRKKRGRFGVGGVPVYIYIYIYIKLDAEA